ncbi:MAG TPA: hydantoinase B/oxoprolinase family protein, partial [Solirubrobacterales bacterium]|nr:hydantoinase B/oxoprolinase family protein [Solirubrobacterales bacterium]
MEPTLAPSLANERRRRAESFVDGYLPPDDLVIDPSLRFHDEADTDLDPVSYEVLRSKLWNVNWDHQETIRRVSGSQVVVYGYDFNTTIQTEDGAGVCFGPGNLFFGGCADVVVKWTLEHRSMNVGINEGDIFLQDDPWIGTNHQMDAAVYAPVFWEGKLFAWVYNVIHQRELGGVEPGGFTQQAHDVYAEPTFFPPMKLVDAGKVREDVVDAWVRRSRLAGLMTLELRSQIAGVEIARARVLELVERYGAARVKGTMRKMIATTAGVVGERLAKLPDGEWSDTRYVSGAVVGDLAPYKYALTVRKEGDRLRYSNAGTDPSVGSFNITAGVLRACITNSLLTFLCYDQYLCAAGLLKQVDFDFERGAITAAHHPAAVSTSLGLVVALVQAQYLNAKMLSTDADAARHTFGVSGCATLIYNHTFGIDQYGTPTANFPLDG